jgi:hypothetical protein
VGITGRDSQDVTWVCGIGFTFIDGMGLERWKRTKTGINMSRQFSGFVY